MINATTLPTLPNGSASAYSEAIAKVKEEWENANLDMAIQMLEDPTRSHYLNNCGAIAARDKLEAALAKFGYEIQLGDVGDCGFDGMRKYASYGSRWFIRGTNLSWFDRPTVLEALKAIQKQNKE